MPLCMNRSWHLGFLSSHGGSSMRAIVSAILRGDLAAQARVVISNNSDAPALDFARAMGVPAVHMSQTKLGNARDIDSAIAEALASHGVELVILSGYLRKLGPSTLCRYRGRILNIHPALLPGYGGTGMYGRRVHEAVIAGGEAVSGVSIHIVDGIYDHGPVIARREVRVEAGDTTETLAQRIEMLEPLFFVETLRRLTEGSLALPE
jgi:phosphoribosylglycinamide formyltransferase 1